MKFKSRKFVAMLAVAATWNAAPRATAVDPPDLFLEHLADFVWTGAGGNTTWENSPNWTAPSFSTPAGYPYPIPTFPNDPGRIDDPGVGNTNTVNITTIYPAVGANLSAAIAADRTVNIATGNVTVASLKLGGTGVAVTTDVTDSSTFRLIFENTELNDTITNPGDPNADPEVEPEPIYGFNQGRSLIWSTGTAAVGKVNRISADIQFNDGVDVEGDRDLHIYGNLVEGVIDRDGFNTGFEENLESSISSLLSNGARLYIHGNIVAVGVNAQGTATSSDGAGGDRRFGINTERGLLVPPDPQLPPPDAPRQGIVEIFGAIQGDGMVSFGTDGGNALPLSSVILHGDSNAFNGRIQVNRVNLVLDHDNAIGGPDAGENDDNKVKAGGPTQSFGFNFISTSDDRNIPAPVEIAQWQTVRGASGIPGLEGIGDHSIEFSGEISQGNTRGWINLLPAGKTLTLSGPVYPNIKAENPPNLGRALTFDGTGKTIISGGIHDQVVTGDEDPIITDKIGYLRTRGTGSVVIDGRVFDGVGTEIGFNDSDYAGGTFVEGANVHFHANGDLAGGEIVSRGGAVGVDTGVTANNSFLTQLRSSSSPSGSSTSPFFATWGDNAGIYTTYSTGGLMLGTVGTNEYAQDLNFTTGDLSRAANMSLAAQEGGSTYTGTITPASPIVNFAIPGAGEVATNGNTYQLGGGSGTLTLPNANQLTGTNSVLVTNGGEVRIQGSNNYSGKTRILRKFLPSNQDQALASQRSAEGNNDATGTAGVNSTLTATTLANGGASSSIGNSSNGASNLVIHDSTLKYVGATTSTDRLFTVGASGAMLDASGTGAVSFTNTGSLAIEVPARRNSMLSTAVPSGGNRTVFGQPNSTTATRREFHTEDLALGMRAYMPNVEFNLQAGGSPVRITSIVNREVMQLGQPDTLDSEEDTDLATTPNAWQGYTFAGNIRVIQFGPAPARFITLTGANTGNNTLASLIGNAGAADIDAAATTPEVAAAEAAEGYGTVGIQKTGAGKWILSGNNTYNWATNVEAGTLLVNGAQTGTGLTTVSNGAAFGGTGQIGGGLTMLEGSIFASAFAGGTIDALNVLGNVDLSALANTLSITGSGVGSSWTLLTYAGMLTGTFESTPGYTVNYGSGSNSLITISAAAGLIGDYNGNGKVDAADYTVWRNNLGGSGTTLGVNRDPANLGVVSTADYNSWKANFGAMAGAGGGGIGGGAVPEPASLVLVGIAFAAAGCSRRRVV